MLDPGEGRELTVGILIAIVLISVIGYLMRSSVFAAEKRDEGRNAVLNSIQYKQKINIKRGLYRGCQFEVHSRDGYYYFNGIVSCPQDPGNTFSTYVHIDNFLEQ